MPSEQKPRTKVKLPRRSPAARSGDAIRVSAKDGESYADILKEMKAKVNPQSAGAEVLSIQRTRREEILLVLKRGGDVSTFDKALNQVVGEKAEVKSLVSKTRQAQEKRLLPHLCIAIGKPDLGDLAGYTNALAVCRLGWSV